MNSVIPRMFIEGAVMLMLCAGLSSALRCNRTQQYPVGYKLSGEILKCIDCRVCAAGYEPKVPCGTLIGVSDSVRDCDPCKNGTYSPKKDFKACQDCLYKKCFEHQVVEGTCTDKNDASYCTAKCEEGHIMNKERTACDIDLVQQTKTTPPATKTTSNPPTSPTTNSNTTKKLVVSHDRTDKEFKLAPGVIVGIVIAAMVVIVIIFMVIRWYRLRRTDPGDKDDKELQATHCTARLLDKTDAGRNCKETVKFSKQDTEKNDSASTSTTSLNETKDEVSGTLIQQEECQQNDLLTSDGPHLKETTGGYVNSSQPSNVPNDLSDISKDCIATQNNSEMSPAPPATSPNPIHVIINPRAHLTRFDHFPCDVYQLILRTFDFGPPGKNCDDLAGWLGMFSVFEVRCFESEKSKTDAIIQSWMSRAENTVPKFVEILEEKGMTYLAGKIRENISNVN